MLPISWLLMNVSFQKHNNSWSPLDCTLSFPAGLTPKPAEQDSGSFSVIESILLTPFSQTILSSMPLSITEMPGC